MILKEADDRTRDIDELKRLKSTFPLAFQKIIQKEIDRIYRGMDGEREAAHFLKREFGHSSEIIVLNDLRLELEGEFAQFDHLVIHRMQRSAWVLETKNYSGRLNCDVHGDWTVWYGNKPISIPSPVNQVRRQRILLEHWLKRNSIEAIQQIYPIVLISPNSSVNRSCLPLEVPVIKSDNFGEDWRKKAEMIGAGKAIGMVARHAFKGLSQSNFVAFGEHLAASHVAATYDWRAKLRLPYAVAPSSSTKSDANRETTICSQRIDTPTNVSTPFGNVTIKRISDQHFALRNDKNDELIELVRNICRGKGSWNPRYRNWIIANSELDSIVSALNDVPRLATD
jgi:Nuclease-related domain